MLCTKGVHHNSEGPFEEWLSLCVFALGLVNSRQVVQGFGHIRMLCTKGVHHNSEGPFEERFSLCVFALGLVKQRQIVQGDG